MPGEIGALVTAGLALFAGLLAASAFSPLSWAEWITFQEYSR